MEQFTSVRFNPQKDPVPRAPGMEIYVVENGRTKGYISAYNRTGAAAKQGNFAVIGYDKDYGVSAIEPEKTSVLVRTAVFLWNQKADDLCWMQIAGKCKALVDGTSAVAAGNTLGGYDDGMAFIKDSTARTAHSAAVALQAQAEASEVLIDVELIPEQHTISGEE